MMEKSYNPTGIAWLILNFKNRTSCFHGQLPQVKGIQFRAHLDRASTEEEYKEPWLTG